MEILIVAVIVTVAVVIAAKVFLFSKPPVSAGLSRSNVVPFKREEVGRASQRSPRSEVSSSAFYDDYEPIRSRREEDVQPYAFSSVAPYTPPAFAPQAEAYDGVQSYGGGSSYDSSPSCDSGSSDSGSCDSGGGSSD